MIRKTTSEDLLIHRENWKFFLVCKEKYPNLAINYSKKDKKL